MTIDPFVETKPPRALPEITSGSDTREFDEFRQGIEITTNAHRYLGPVKISAGSDDHSLYFSEFGQLDYLNPDNFFEERDEYSAQYFVTSSKTHEKVVISNFRGGFEELYDGVIEPLTIRHVAMHSTTYFPYDAHGIFGEFQQGNPDLFGRCEQIVSTRQIKSPRVEIPFFDAADTFGSITLPGVVADVFSLIDAFVDNVRSRSIEEIPPGAVPGANPALIDDHDMSAVLTHASSSVEEMLNLGEISMTSGFVYEVPTRKEVLSGTNPVTGYKLKTPYSFGTDSIAFGGLTQ